MITASEEKVARFNFQERAIHWLAALSFLYAAFTGLALWSPRLFWLASMFGGGNTVRGWHPWGLGFMFRNWAGQMRLDADDRAWLRQSHRYAMHDEEGLLEAGRFNAGQKMLFWTQFMSTQLLFFSGLVLWFPETMPRSLRLTAVLIHRIRPSCPLAASSSTFTWARQLFRRLFAE